MEKVHWIISIDNGNTGNFERRGREREKEAINGEH